LDVGFEDERRFTVFGRVDLDLARFMVVAEEVDVVIVGRVGGEQALHDQVWMVVADAVENTVEWAAGAVGG
jgi:hypothetical protein